MVTDYAAFLSEFGIDPAEPESATLKTLSTTYGFEVDDARSYIESHKQ